LRQDSGGKRRQLRIQFQGSKKFRIRGSRGIWRRVIPGFSIQNSEFRIPDSRISRRSKGSQRRSRGDCKADGFQRHRLPSLPLAPPRSLLTPDSVIARLFFLAGSLVLIVIMIVIILHPGRMRWDRPVLPPQINSHRPSDESIGRG
jgi:hypothetical protein